MPLTMENYRESERLLRQKLGDFVPQTALVLGSGLGFLADLVENPISVAYKDIPHFAASTAPGHAGRLVFGRLAGRRVAVMQGRVHYYEGYSYEETAYCLRVLRLLGAEEVLITNACGSVNTAFSVGDIMLITDHLKFFDESPLRGENLPDFGLRFPDMSYAYTPALREVARRAAKSVHVPLREGVYIYFPGPQYETPAEIRAVRVLGADVVGMSTVPEVIVAAHAGMKVLGFSLVCNMAAGVLDQPLTEGEVLEAAKNAKTKFSALVLKCLEMM